MSRSALRAYVGQGGRNAAAAPIAVGIGALAACTVVAVVDPNQPGRYPTCPFLAVTGRWCPGCGTLRAVHALFRGDVVAAVGFNVLTVALLPVLGWAWWAWLRHRTGRRRLPPALSPAAGYAVAAIVPLFWVLRNLSAGAALAP